MSGRMRHAKFIRKQALNALSIGVVAATIILYKGSGKGLSPSSKQTEHDTRSYRVDDIAGQPADHKREAASFTGRLTILGLDLSKPSLIILTLAFLAISALALIVVGLEWRHYVYANEEALGDAPTPVLEIIVLCASGAWATLLHRAIWQYDSTRFLLTLNRAGWLQRNISAAGLVFVFINLVMDDYVRVYVGRDVDGILPSVAEAALIVFVLLFTVLSIYSWWGHRLHRTFQEFRLRDVPSILASSVTVCLLCLLLLWSAWFLWSGDKGVPTISVRGLELPIVPPPEDWLWLAVILAIGVFAYTDKIWIRSSTGPRKWLARTRLTVRRVGIPIVVMGWIIRLYADRYYWISPNSDQLPSPLLFGLLLVVVFIGAVLVWRGRAEAGSRSTLGATLLGGVLVALVVFVLQFTTEGYRQRVLDRQSIQLTVASRQNLSHYPLSNQDLSGMYMRGKILRGADLTRTDLSGADLSHSDLSGAILLEARLDGADLTRAHLRKSILSYTIVNGNLERADLQGAYLCGTDLTGAFLDGANLKDVAFDDATEWPDGFSRARLGSNSDSRSFCESAD
jgi:Pentapeptide repeats (8 copies)